MIRTSQALQLIPGSLALTGSLVGEQFATLIMQAAALLPQLESSEYTQIAPATVGFDTLAGLAKAASNYTALQAELAEKRRPLYLTFEDDDNAEREIDWLDNTERQPDCEPSPTFS